ncbi:MAG TPA: sulfurtransferase [Gemmatimonadales bacterium]|nr:sulfurtransferase [Gemmatimonadales bacterium]
MQSTPATPLVSADELAARLGDPSLAIVDASWHLPSAGRDAEAEYRTAHIPGAVRLDLDQVADLTSDLPHMLPTPERFARAMEQLGIGRDHEVVVYDTSGVNLSAPRAWWMFRCFGHDRVRVLDGGFRAWAAKTRPIQTGTTRRSPTGYRVPPRDASLVVDRAGIEAILAGTRDAQLADCRAADRFEGRVDEPRPGLARGHIAGAKNLPFATLTDPETGAMHPPPVLRALLAERGLDPARPIVAYCGSGTSACALALAIEVLRAADPAHVGPPVAIYDGSWAEYGRRSAI